MILLIDNYDSFSYNLYQALGAINPDIRVIRNDEMTVEEILALAPERIVISPGPGRPEDAGVIVELIRNIRTTPVLGVCLGHQAICQAFGATVTYAKELMHGKASRVQVKNNSPLFAGLPETFKVARYHSLAADPETIPPELTVTAVREGYRRIIVVGGDGTLHEVVNGLFIQQEVCPDEVLVAVVAVGTGNDWVRTFGISNRYQDAAKAISEGYSFLQDVGVVSYEEAHYRQSRYMANVAGAGFDAHVVRKLSHLQKKGHRSRWRYTWCLVKNFFRYKSTGVKVWVDDRLVYNNLLLSAAIGICKFNGGGIQQLPAAVADDGMLDLSLIRPVHFWHLLFRFHYLFNGGIYRIRHILQERGSRIRIESSPEVSVEIDGEPLGHTPLEFSILHRAIRIVVARDFYQRCAAVGAETPAG